MKKQVIEHTQVKPLAVAGRKEHTPSLEYEMVSGLALQQYMENNRICFEKLLAIPLTERIPALSKEFGIRRMHRLICLVAEEFCFSLPFSVGRRFTQIKISVLACELILAAREDQLSLEDLILFFELSLKGRWGKVKELASPNALMESLDHYRQDRFEAYVNIKEEMQKVHKMEGPFERSSPEPRPIRNIFDEVHLPQASLKKTS